MRQCGCLLGSHKTQLGDNDGRKRMNTYASMFVSSNIVLHSVDTSILQVLSIPCMRERCSRKAAVMVKREGFSVLVAICT